jgi:hypothetical protein
MLTTVLGLVAFDRSVVAAAGTTVTINPSAPMVNTGIVSVESVSLLGATGSGPSGGGTLATVSVIGIGPGTATVAVTNLEVFTRAGSTLVPFWTQSVTNNQVTVADVTPTPAATP